MSSSSAKTLVLVTAGLLFAAIAVKRNSIADPYRYAWAAGVITIFLSILADIAPEIAGPFAVLLLFAVYVKNRKVLGPLVPTIANTKAASTSSAAATGGQTSSGPLNTIGGAQ